MNDTPIKPAVGIDLGTTFSVIAHVNDVGRPETIPNAEGDLLTPSVILFDEDEVIVGREAAKARATELEKIADCPKRQIGNQVYDKVFGDRRYPPEALQGWILNKLKRDAARVAGNFEEAVITVPAYFDEVRRKSTQDSGFIGGLKVLDIINEPTAAAVAYGYQAGWIDLSGKVAEPINVLVYDLGGGTFDVTVMEVGVNRFRTIATDGDMRLGGQDWDQRLIDHVAKNFKDNYGIDPTEDSTALGKLLRDCKDAKETLSSRSKASIECVFGSSSIKTDISREMFEDLTLDLLDRTDFTVRQTLKAAKLAWTDIDKVILVGGSTRMPAVRDMLASLSGQEPDCSLSPDEAVAHGAALRAAMLSNRHSNAFTPSEIKNVNSHTLGVVANEIETGIAKVVPLIPRNTPLPVVARRVFKTHRKNQESILVQIVEGENSTPEDCSQLGRCAIWDLPDTLDVGTLIEVRFAYEENGRLKIKVKVGGSTQKAFRYEIQRPNSLTDEQLASWREYICESDE
ncbi:Hsp70 family protein [Mariniblastus sp.]|nr:Hsp70 family protein [Mariniblastus sp.]MDC0294113.1 Hsp70 family protein [Mariniblastus sp.]